MADVKGVRGTRPPGPNSFNFMQFLGKFGKIVCWRPLEIWSPHLREILDPPLAKHVLGDTRPHAKLAGTFSHLLMMEEISVPWNGNSVNAVNSGHQKNYRSIVWGQFKDPVSHLCLAGAFVASLSLTHEATGSKPLMIDIFAELSGNI